MPTIISHAPFEEPEALDIVNVCVKDIAASQVKGGVAAGHPFGVKAYVEGVYGKAVEKTYTTQSFARGTSAKRAAPGSTAWSAVWWEVAESASRNTCDGVGLRPNFTFALLLERSTDEEFTAHIKLSWNCFLRRHEMATAVTFDPRIQARRCQQLSCFGLRPNPGNHLRQWSDKGKIAELVRSHHRPSGTE